MHFLNEFGSQVGEVVDLSPLDAKGIIRLLNAKGITTSTPKMTFKPKEFTRTANCIAWRETANCNPHGQRVPTNDASCSDTIYAVQAGFCECTKAPKKMFTCEEGRAPFTCEEACTYAEEF
eukprot:TRINITY_DN5411_c1_g1_i1.p1 TRINITY_DN5411_c1_g1~~TRINITY_DN5411_c1_g1_i1.p1  ORF type:complete len:121 (+),score=8.83 TRINITY_DN5411_c1_g1_i1:269-631(+)